MYISHGGSERSDAVRMVRVVLPNAQPVLVEICLAVCDGPIEELRFKSVVHSLCIRHAYVVVLHKMNVRVKRSHRRKIRACRIADDVRCARERLVADAALERVVTVIAEIVLCPDVL